MQLEIDPKAALRREARARRQGLHAHAGAGHAVALVKAAVQLPVRAGQAVSAYWPIRDEADPRALLAAFAARGHVTCLPVAQARDAPLVFRRWTEGDEMAPDLFGIPAPLASAETVIPEVMFVPLLAFDRRGHRLGYGAGFYDRTIAQARAGAGVLAAGVAFAGQEMPQIPSAPHDVPLDWVLTEREAIRAKG